MLTRNPRNTSYIISLLLHLTIIIVFAFINLSVGLEEDDYVTVGFGSGVAMGSSGPIGKDTETEKPLPNQEQLKQKNDEQKKVDLPKSNALDNENIIKEANKKKQKEELIAEKIKPLNDNRQKSKGTEAEGEGVGGFGFELDFGGKGMRKIYSYTLPEYPEGVSKEIDVKLRFTILPDGTVGKIFPLIKADARLEMAAINSLRQWRFEPLPPNAKQVEQTAVITFPYRLQ